MTAQKKDETYFGASLNLLVSPAKVHAIICTIINRVFPMLKRLMLVSGMCICLQVMAVENATVPDTFSKEKSSVITMVPEILALAKAIVSDMVKDKTPEEILNMVNEIALALSINNLCGLEAIQAMLDVDIPFEMAFDSIVTTCKPEGPARAALSLTCAGFDRSWRGRGRS